ncbi:hypothetical protein U1Q18_002388 [Sarracenia purpurea var. burkii]
MLLLLSSQDHPFQTVVSRRLGIHGRTRSQTPIVVPVDPHGARKAIGWGESLCSSRSNGCCGFGPPGFSIAAVGEIAVFTISREGRRLRRCNGGGFVGRNDWGSTCGGRLGG